MSREKMTETERKIWTVLKKCHVQGLAALAKGTGMDPVELLPHLESLMKKNRVWKKTRCYGRVVFSAWRQGT